MSRDPSTALLHAMPPPSAGDPAGSTLTMSSYVVSAGVADASDYLRSDHPNWRAVERGLGTLEEADAVLFASGQAASHALLADLARSHRRIVVPDDGYYNTRELARHVGGVAGVDVVTVDLLDAAAVDGAVAVGGAALWVETPTNPLLRVADLAELGAICARHGTLMVADNTVATAVLQQPARFGAAATVYSLTKAVAGHSDLLLGAVVTQDAELVHRLRQWRTLTGGIPGAFEAWLATRSLSTLALRISAQSAGALEIARHLRHHGLVTAVHHPGVAPRRVVADRQMTGGYGPLVSFEVAGGAGRVHVRLLVPPFFRLPRYGWLILADARAALSLLPWAEAIDLCFIDDGVGGRADAGVPPLFDEPGSERQRSDIRRTAFLNRQLRLVRSLLTAGCSAASCSR